MYTYTTHRPSIIHRPLKSPSQSNVETVESQYEREQEYWRTRTSKHHDTQTRLNNSLYPTQQLKQAFHSELHASIQQQEQHRAACRQQPEPDATQVAGHLRRQQQLSPEHLQRPWTATTLAYSKQDEDAARRRHAQAVARENEALMQQRQVQRQQQQRAEALQDRHVVQSEGHWWNLGAVGERWIPPEHRVRHKPAECRPPLDMRPPWACDTDDAGAARQRPAGTSWGSQQASHGAANQRPTTAPAKEYPWTWHA